LKLFDFLCASASKRRHPALNPSCHGETCSPCPFRSIVEAPVLNLVARLRSPMARICNRIRACLAAGWEELQSFY
jgi:hypothetical protein